MNYCEWRERSREQANTIMTEVELHDYYNNSLESPS